MSFLNWIDILCLLFLIAGVYLGFKRGFVFEVFRFAGVITALFFVLYWYRPLAGFINKYCFLMFAAAKIISFLVLIVLIIIIARGTAVLIQKGIKIQVNKKIDRVAGAVLGLIRYMVMVSLLLMFFLFIPWSYLKTSIYDRSVLGQHLVKIAPAIYSGLVKFFPSHGHIGVKYVLDQAAENN